MDIAIALVVGLAAGTHTATWGMYKDAPYEGFTYRKFFRSVVLSAIIAVIVEASIHLHMREPASMVILFGLTYAIERGCNEFYKTFLRDEDQSKYSIPMQLAVRGVVVDSRRTRALAGAAYLIGVGAVIGGIYALQERAGGTAGIGAILVIGSAGGWISAFGGAWKDAPHEGFQIFKFFRSPAVSLTYAVMLAALTTSYVAIALGALGYTIATLETYKTFFKPNTPRGKFAGKEILYPGMLERRHSFVPLYVAIWMAMVIGFVVALARPHSGVI